MPTTVELEIFVARGNEGVRREGVDGGAQVGLVGGTGDVVVGVVAQERGVAEGGVEGGGEEGEEEEEEGSGWVCEGEHGFFLFCCFCSQNCQLPSVQLPRIDCRYFLNLFFSSLLSKKKTKSQVKLHSHIP